MLVLAAWKSSSTRGRLEGPGDQAPSLHAISLPFKSDRTMKTGLIHCKPQRTKGSSFLDVQNLRALATVCPLRHIAKSVICRKATHNHSLLYVTRSHIFSLPSQGLSYSPCTIHVLNSLIQPLSLHVTDFMLCVLLNVAWPLMQSMFFIRYEVHIVPVPYMFCTCSSFVYFLWDLTNLHSSFLCHKASHTVQAPIRHKAQKQPKPLTCHNSHKHRCIYMCMS